MATAGSLAPSATASSWKREGSWPRCVPFSFLASLFLSLPPTGPCQQPSHGQCKQEKHAWMARPYYQSLALIHSAFSAVSVCLWSLSHCFCVCIFTWLFACVCLPQLGYVIAIVFVDQLPWPVVHERMRVCVMWSRASSVGKKNLNNLMIGGKQSPRIWLLAWQFIL